ncbi:hypothetical protein BGZ97_007817 [Linnemannia gamsii]|uniref:Extracellular membrane protein CFEM domain-containing protein n=1 Tax=Linnemannia gamsii TaxID=64522 RepID=A0A9P6QRS3_9FUNG|nr:hypothetical protein BGZ97_007817 [Linnemannia gamsii]
MHFTTTVASALALILAASSTTVSAQQQPGGTLSPACVVCLVTAAIVLSPTCDGDTILTSNAPEAMTPAERACLCPLASDPSATWVQTCIPEACVAEEVTPLAQAFIASKDAICANGGVTPPPPVTSAPATSGAPAPPTTTGKPTTVSNKPANATSAALAPPKPTGKSGAVGSLFGSSDKVVAGAALAIASVAALLL